MFFKAFLISFLIINGNFSYAYGLNEKFIEKVVQGELEILDSKSFSEERKLFDTLVLFFSDEKNNVNENLVIDNLKNTSRGKWMERTHHTSAVFLLTFRSLF